MTVAWDQVTHDHLVRALEEYYRLGPDAFFSAHGFAPTTTYDLIWDERGYPPKAILGTAYELATGQRLASADFEGGKSGAVKVLGKLGFTVQPRQAGRARLTASAAHIISIWSAAVSTSVAISWAWGVPVGPALITRARTRLVVALVPDQRMAAARAVAILGGELLGSEPVVGLQRGHQVVTGSRDPTRPRLHLPSLSR